MNDELNGQGQFRGDFSRDTHDPLRRFSRVLMQQGRVMLDADWNEQNSILLRFLRTLAADLIGPYGGSGDAFSISANVGDTDFTIGEGHYYVNGVLCENTLSTDDKGTSIPLNYYAQPDYPLDKKNSPLAQVDANGKVLNGLAYLDVWERHVTFNETGDPDSPGIREVALGGPDTASRAQVVWQVKVIGTAVTAAQLKKSPKFFPKILADAGVFRVPGTAGRLQARAKKAAADGSDCPCVISPESRYRGVENQLYRVEVHNGGGLWDDKTATGASFKWSRENGSVVFPILKLSGNQVTVASLGRDQRLGLKVDDWVEVVDDDQALRGKAGSLLKVTDIDAASLVVTLSGTPSINSTAPLTRHPLLRRWDSAKGVDNVVVPALNGGWLPLEDGIEIKFSSTGAFQNGDYWLIPARVATGDVEWPGPVDSPASLPPHGVQHYYAPLSFLAVDASGKFTAAPTDCRSLITPLVAS